MKIFAAVFFLFLSSQAFADAKLLVKGLNADLLQRSPAGIQVGIKFSDGVVVNPSFTLEELNRGVFEKTIAEVERSIISCTYNWFFVAKSDDFSPRDFQGVSGGVCRESEGQLIIESPAHVRRVKVTVKKSAFEDLAATRLVLTSTAEDSLGSMYPQRTRQIGIAQAPFTSERVFVQVANSEINFILKPFWVRSSGNVEGEIVSFKEDQFVFE